MTGKITDLFASNPLTPANTDLVELSRPGSPAASGAASVGLLRAPNNIAATDPGIANDNTQGYFVGASWFNSTTGNEFNCLNASTGAAVWVKITSPSGPGAVSGHYYGPPTSVASTTLVVVANTMYAVPFQLQSITTFNALGFSVSAGAAGTHGIIGIYSNVGGLPGSLLAQPTSPLACSAATAVTGAFTSNPTLMPDWYWLCVIFDGAPTMVAISGGDHALANLTGSDSQGRQFGTGALNNHYEGASTYAAGLPSTAPTLALSFGNVPNIQAKAA